MNKEEVIKKVNAFLAEEFEVEESTIVPDAILKDTLGLDSLDYVDLVVVIESNFGFKVKGEDFINIVTFNDFYEYIMDKVAEKQLK
jgi:acyl carrier protein